MAGAPRKKTKKLPILALGQARRQQLVRCIRALPRGKVSTYGAVACAAGWPGAARQVVRVLNQVPNLPWHRVVGAGGAIKLPGEAGAEQRFRLRMEGVTFRGARVDMARHEHKFAVQSAASRQLSAISRQRKPALRWKPRKKQK